MLERPRGYEDLSLEKQKQKAQAYSARNRSAVLLGGCRAGQSRGEQSRRGGTFATERTVPNVTRGLTGT